MSSRLLAALSIASYLLTGCAAVDVLGIYPLALVDGWVEQREYGKALAALDRVPETDPRHVEATRESKRIRALAEAYENEVIERGEQLRGEERWGDALVLYGQALDHLGNSPRIAKVQAETRRLRDARSATLENALLEERGRWLNETLKLYEEMLVLRPRDRSVGSVRQALTAEARRVAAELHRRAGSALAGDDLETAERELRLALNLHRRADYAATLAAVETARNVRREHVQQAKERTLAAKKQQEYESLLAAYRTSLDDRDYVQARKTMARLEAEHGDVREVRTLSAALKRILERRADALLAEGMAHYSAGRFEQAVASWKQLLELVPGHTEAREHLTRARRVLENVEQLRRKQGES